LDRLGHAQNATCQTSVWGHVADPTRRHGATAEGQRRPPAEVLNAW
jgi:hypothetical protein